MAGGSFTQNKRCWRISGLRIRRRARATASPRRISFTISTACCIPPTTAADTPITSARNSRAFSKAGRELAHWHLQYETVALHPGAKLDTGKTAAAALAPAQYRVVKMKFAKTRDPETNKSINDKTTVIYNDHITIRAIPLEAYEYVVNGKPALEWVMERQCVSTDKDSGIVNDANLWATETMNNPRYPLELLQRVITVSLETMKIVHALPRLEID